MPRFQEGIYLQVTKGKIGTGHTASDMTYKNYYAVRSLGERLELYLLGDDMQPIGLRETKSLSGFDAGFEYQPDQHDNFREIMTGMGHKVEESG